MERGLTQLELAEKIGVVQGTIYFWENGKTDPTGSCLIMLAKFFDVSIDELMGLEPLPPTSNELIEINSLLYNLNDQDKKLCLDIIKAVVKNKSK